MMYEREQYTLQPVSISPTYYINKYIPAFANEFAPLEKCEYSTVACFRNLQC